MPENDLLLKDFRPHSALQLEEHVPERAKFPVIDAHNHLGYHDLIILPFYYGQKGWLMPDIEKGIELMDELNIRVVVNLDGAFGDQTKINIERYKVPYPDRFAVFCGLDWDKVNQPGFGEMQAKKLEGEVIAGAQGLKIWNSLGLRYRDENGRLIMPDDPRLDPVWQAAGEQGIPVLIHTADPVAFFWPLDETNERWEELHDIPDAHWYGKDYPRHIDLIESLLQVVEKHSGTTFIAAHVLSYAENLKYVGNALDRYSNLYVDTGERIGELCRQPYSAWQFMIDYQDRILFGVDIPNDRRTYQTYFRALETMDEYFDYGRKQGRYAIYGLHLPDDVLEKVYHLNAMKVIPGLSI